MVPPSTRFATRNVVIGVGGRNEQTSSSKFMEYRSYPNGAVLPYLRFFGEDKVLYDISARNALQDDAWYGLRLEKDWFGLRGQFTRIPHGFGNDAVSVLHDMGNGEFRIPDALQQQNQTTIENAFNKSKPSVTFAFLNGLASGMVSGTGRMRVGLQRDRGNLELSLTRNQPVDVRLAYSYEDRAGNRGSGTSFGFGNVVETPEPIDYRTHDVSLNAEWAQKWGLLRGGLRFNRFDNKIPVQTFDNPFRITDATYGQWTQDETFIPFTTNTAITVPFRATDPSHLPAPRLNGRIDTTTLAAMF